MLSGRSFMLANIVLLRNGGACLAGAIIPTVEARQRVYGRWLS